VSELSRCVLSLLKGHIRLLRTMAHKILKDPSLKYVSINNKEYKVKKFYNVKNVY